MESILEGKQNTLLTVENIHEALISFGMSNKKSTALACFISGYHLVKNEQPELFNKIYNTQPKTDKRK